MKTGPHMFWSKHISDESILQFELVSWLSVKQTTTKSNLNLHALIGVSMDRPCIDPLLRMHVIKQICSSKLKYSTRSRDMDMNFNNKQNIKIEWQFCNSLDNFSMVHINIISNAT